MKLNVSEKEVVPAVPAVVKKTFVLELTEQDAANLLDIVGRITGSSEETPRGTSDAIYHSLVEHIKALPLPTGASKRNEFGTAQFLTAVDSLRYPVSSRW